MWTKDNVKKLLEIWEHKNISEICSEMGLEAKQVAYMVVTLRAKGFNLTKKRVPGKLQSLLDEVAGELGIELKK